MTPEDSRHGEAILAIAGRYGARNLRIFGSVVGARRMLQAMSIFWSTWSLGAACST
jgi:hypothetical protein